jgi:hypothetical protein
VLTGKDPYYVKARALGRLYVPFDDTGHPIEQRVGRHLAAVSEFALAVSAELPERPIEIDGIPEYEDLLKRGVGAFLRPPR